MRDARLRFKPAAADDLDQAYNWYEEQRPGLGPEFMVAIDECLDRIARRPETFPAFGGMVRRALLVRFPYAIYFRIKDETAVIFAVLHVKRDPGKWQGRV